MKIFNIYIYVIFTILAIALGVAVMLILQHFMLWSAEYRIIPVISSLALFMGLFIGHKLIT